MFVYIDPCNHATSRFRTATVTLLTFLALPVVGSAQVASDVVQVPIEEVVVVGSRALPRSVEESSVPVDIIGAEDFENQAGFDMSNLIRSAVPSFHVSDNPSRDLAALLRPVNLRGLAPDHTLVLMNNKRRHRGSVIQWIVNRRAILTPLKLIDSTHLVVWTDGVRGDVDSGDDCADTSGSSGSRGADQADCP